MSTPRKKSASSAETAQGPVERLFSVLALAARMGLISVADVVYVLDLPRPTAHRMIATLRDLELLQKMPVRGKYAVAPKLVGLAASILGSTIVYAPIQTLMKAVAQKTNETCGLAVMAHGEIEYLASVMGQSPLTLQFQAGQRTPLHCTSSGQVHLAGLPDEELQVFLNTGPWDALTPRTIVEPQVLMERIRKVRAQGYAANESEYIFGVVGAAVPVHNADGQVVAALTISAPRIRRSLEEIVDFVPLLKSYAYRVGKVI